jgi:hypothetical protein
MAFISRSVNCTCENWWQQPKMARGIYLHSGVASLTPDIWAAPRSINHLREDKNYISQFVPRMRGEGVHADLLSNRFKLARKRLGFDAQHSHWPKLDCTRFLRPLPPRVDSPQGSLF